MLRSLLDSLTGHAESRRLTRVAVLAAVLSCSYAFASTAILRAPTPPGQSWSVQTYAGPAEIIVSPLRPSPSTTILILPDTLSSTNKEQVRRELLDLYSQFHGRPVQVAFLGKKGELTGPVPVLTRLRFKQLLEMGISGEDSGLVPTASVLDDLIAVIPKLGPNRSAVLLVGELPNLDAASTAFASALLIRAFTAQQLRLSLFSPAPVEQDWLLLFRSLGGESVATPHELLPVSPSPTAVFQLDWTVPPPAAGFVVFRSTVADPQGVSVVDVPDFSAAVGAPTPTVEQYSNVQKKIAEAEILVAEEPLTQARADRVREDIQTVLQINSRDPEALTVATSLYEKAQDYHAAASMSGFLVEVRPRDGAAYAMFGHALQLNSEFDRAEAALKRAGELGIATAQLNEDFARVHIARKDDKGALPYLQEVVRLDGKRQDIWFLRAQVAERVEDKVLAQRSYEQGLLLGGVHITEVGSLLRLYIATKHTDQAAQLAKVQLASLPPEPEGRLQFAEILDELHSNSFVLEAWRRLLDVQPTSERAHTRVAQLLLEGGDPAGAEEEATVGLTAIPNSAPLRLVKAEAQQSQGRIYQARRTLQEGAAIQDLPLATQLASTEERFFGGAPAAYARLAELSAPSSPAQVRALQRGFDMSMRDGNLQQAAKFASSLEASGQKQYRSLLGTEKSKISLVMVPGGLSALAFTARASKEEIPPDRFFFEYSRTLVDGGVDSGKIKYVDGIREYFERIGSLRALDANAPGDAVITLSLTDKVARHQTEKALSVLGIRLRSSKGEVELSQGENKSQALKQETAAALALDEVGIQEALRAGKTYRLVIPDEPASVYPSEQIWRDGLKLKSYGPGGFAEELVRVPHMARLYVGLNSMDRAAAGELLKAIPFHELCDHESDLLYYYAPALALEGTHSAVPGGPKAEPIWTRLVGASPSTPGPFFRALLKHDDGRLLVYFSILAQLDRPHQTFFTANDSRAKQFYDLLTSTRQMASRPYAGFQDSGFQRMLRSVPLDDQGHVDFPGSAEVWTVAKGRSTDEEHTAHLMKKVRKAAAPDLEDAVLVRLAGTQYKENNIRLTELDNFLAVSSIDAHRAEPMDEETALLLAQRYGDYAALYPYLTDLRTLTENDYRQFFSAFDRVAAHSPLDANLQLGQLHALTELICLLVQRRAIKDEEAADLFRKMVASFVAADDAAAYTSASLESARALLRVCKRNGFSSADEALRSCLLGHHSGSNDERAKHFMRVVDAQHVPSLSTLLEIYDAANDLFAAKTPLGSVQAIQKDVDSLPMVELPKGTKISGEEKNAILRYDPASARKVVVQMKEKTSKRKINPKDLQKLARELQAELQPQVVAALVGPIYAYFLRSSDVIVMNDPLLLRKHHYFEFSVHELQHQKILVSEFSATSESAGSYFIGGFVQFAYSAGMAAVHSKNLAGSAESMAAQLATIRSSEWEWLDESVQRLAALRIIVAREWIYESARQPELLHALNEQTVGLLSLSRRSALLNGIASREWRHVWDSITLPELLTLGGRYAREFPNDPWSSQATVALRAAEKTDRDWRLNILGPIPTHIFGCNHPHLLSDAPYEEYERHLPAEMGERSAELKLFLAFQGDSMGLQPEALENIDEKLALKAFRKAQMTDYRDWRSLMNAYASVNAAELEQAMRND